MQLDEFSDESSPRSHLRRVLTSTAVAAVALAALGLWLWSYGAEQRAIRKLPEAERQALCERTVETLKSVCKGDGPLALHDYCRQQAEFVLGFPECDAECEALAQTVLAQRVR